MGQRASLQLAFDQMAAEKIQRIVETSLGLYKRTTGDDAFREAIKDFLL